MASYTQGQAAVKRQKIRESARSYDSNEFFPGVPRAEYRPDAVVGDLHYRYYNASERIHGRCMEDWLRIAVPISSAISPGIQNTSDSTIDPFGETYKRRIRSSFEFFIKIGIKLYCLWDIDVLPDLVEPVDGVDSSGKNVSESVTKAAPSIAITAPPQVRGDVLELLADLQQKAGARPLWVAPDLKSNPRYRLGAGSAPDCPTVNLAGVQLKRTLDLAQRLNSEGILIQGDHEGYESALTTDINRELRMQGRLLKMVAEYKDRLGYRGQLLFEAATDADSKCSREQDRRGFGLPLNSLQGRQRVNLENVSSPRYRYTYDGLSALCLLKHFNLDRSYKLQVPPGPQLYLSAAYGMVGSVNLGVISSAPDVRDATALMKQVLEQGGLGQGGICLALAPASDPKEHLSTYICAIDTLARGLRAAAKIIAEQAFSKNLQNRYLSYQSGYGARLASGEIGLEECEEQWRIEGVGAPLQHARDGQWEVLLGRYADSAGTIK